jgi:hypothetical protein
LPADALNAGVSVAPPWVRAQSLAIFTSSRSKRACGRIVRLGRLGTKISLSGTLISAALMGLALAFLVRG